MAERKSKATEAAKDSPAPNEEQPKAAKAPAAAPLEAPQPKPVPEPEPSLMVPPNAVAPQTPHNVTGTRLLDADGNPMALEDFLEYPPADAPRHETEHPQIVVQDPWRLVRVTKRVYREYTHPGSTTTVTQLLYPEGARITKAEADRLRPEAMPSPRGAGV